MVFCIRQIAERLQQVSDTLIYLPSLRLLSDISSFDVLNSMLLYSMLLDWLQTADMSQHLAHMLTRLLWL